MDESTKILRKCHGIPRNTGPRGLFLALGPCASRLRPGPRREARTAARALQPVVRRSAGLTAGRPKVAVREAGLWLPRALPRFRPPTGRFLSLIHISEPTRLGMISYAV